jgi:amino acid transporter
MVAGGLLMGLVAACFAQAGSRFRRAGGAYLFVHQAFGARAGFAMGWLSIVSRLFTFATITNLALTYGSALVPGIASGVPRVAAVLVLILGLAAPVLRGVALSAWASNIFTACKLALLVGFVVIAVPTLARQGVAVTPLPPIGHWTPALLMLLFGLTGLESVVINNAEMRNPARDIPVALAAGIAAVVALYAGVLLASAALVPDLAASTRPLFDGARMALGPAAGAAVVAGGVVSMCGVLFVIMFTAPREIQALATNGQLPAVLARLHPRWHTPAPAICVYASIACAVALFSPFLVTLSAATLSRLMMYAATAGAVLRLRGYAETAAPLQLPLGPCIPVAVLILCGAVISQSTRLEAISLTVALLPGLLLAITGKSSAPPNR